MDEVTAKRPVVEVAAVVLHYGNVLLVKRDDRASGGRWSIPSGPVQWGESLPQAVERIVLAATAIMVIPGEVIHAYDLMLPEEEGIPAEQRIIIEIEAQYSSGELQRGATVLDAAWVSGLALPSMEADGNTLGLLTELGIIDGR